MKATAFDPAAAAASVVDAARIGTKANIAFAAAGLPASVVTDRCFLVHILQNLLSNALRYEAGGGVRVQLRYLPGSAAREGTLEGTVEDHGCGMSQEQCARLFELFESAAPGCGLSSGLGLYIVRACARRAGGDCSVVSSPGQGAAFTFTLPVTDVQQPADSTSQLAAASTMKRRHSSTGDISACGGKEAKPTASLRCLLADDHELNLRLVTRLLQQSGLTVTAARDGREAYDKLVAAYAAGAPPHVALLDQQMPQLLGTECASQFRQWELENGPRGRRLPLILFTANAWDEQRTACVNAGMDLFLTKPLVAESLADIHRRAEETAEGDRRREEASGSSDDA